MLVENVGKKEISGIKVEAGYFDATEELSVFPLGVSDNGRIPLKCYPLQFAKESKGLTLRAALTHYLNLTDTSCDSCERGTGILVVDSSGGFPGHLLTMSRDGVLKSVELCQTV